jgi:hypothetical protein
MSWVTIIWSMVASACLTLAAMYLLVWCRERRSWAYLCFFVMAVGVVGLVAGELATMYAKSPTEYGTALRWSHFAFGFVVLGSLGFVHFCFGTGNWWLLGAALVLRLLTVVANFSAGLNLHISAIQSLQQVFVPFYPTKPHGLGLGLSVCRTIIAAHHGKISVENNAAGGATFRLTLPVVEEG